MALCLESGYTSLNKKNEELCGDNVESTVCGGYTTLVLADGMGSGVKANILSTLTSKILCTMVSENIEIFTKSYLEDAKGVHWESDGESTYTIEECDIAERGTKIVMHIADSEKEFLEEGTIRNLIDKYCSFMPVEIWLSRENRLPRLTIWVEVSTVVSRAPPWPERSR